MGPEREKKVQYLLGSFSKGSISGDSSPKMAIGIGQISSKVSPRHVSGISSAAPKWGRRLSKGSRFCVLETPDSGPNLRPNSANRGIVEDPKLELPIGFEADSDRKKARIQTSFEYRRELLFLVRPEHRFLGERTAHEMPFVTSVVTLAGRQLPSWILGVGPESTVWYRRGDQFWVSQVQKERSRGARTSNRSGSRMSPSVNHRIPDGGHLARVETPFDRPRTRTHV